MSERDKIEIESMVQTARYLAENDPQGLMLAKNSMDILKARCEMERETKIIRKDRRLCRNYRFLKTMNLDR